MNLRLRFTKTGLAACLSHLDTMRTLERACRRASLPLVYSQGFNPRPRLAFGPALPVGTESLTEFFDVEVESGYPLVGVMPELNRQLPVGLQVVAAWELPSQTPSLTVLIAASEYRVLLSGGGGATLARAVGEILEASSWVVQRARKEEADVRPLVHDLTYTGGELWLTLAAGAQGTLRPDDCLRALAQACDGCFDPACVQITRTRVLSQAVGGELTPLDKDF